MSAGEVEDPEANDEAEQLEQRAAGWNRVVMGTC